MLRILGKALCIGDLAVVLVLFFSALLPTAPLLYAGWYLLVKGGIFAALGNIVSMIDVLCGIYLFFLAFGISSGFLTIIAMLFLGQKVLFGLLV